MFTLVNMTIAKESKKCIMVKQYKGVGFLHGLQNYIIIQKYAATSNKAKV